MYFFLPSCSVLWLLNSLLGEAVLYNCVSPKEPLVSTNTLYTVILEWLCYGSQALIWYPGSPALVPEGWHPRILSPHWFFSESLRAEFRFINSVNHLRKLCSLMPGGPVWLFLFLFDQSMSIPTRSSVNQCPRGCEDPASGIPMPPSWPVT